MQSTATFSQFRSPKAEYHRGARYKVAAPERRAPLRQAWLLAGGSSLFLWGLIGTAVWHFLG